MTTPDTPAERQASMHTEYSVVVLRSAYHPDLQGMERPYIRRDDDDNEQSGLSLDLASRIARELDGDLYSLSHNEVSRPTYLVVDDRTAEYYAGGRDGDGGNYDWDNVDCESRDKAGNQCGECATCISAMIDQDRAALREEAKNDND
jgi:hypothetical protein